MLYEGPVEAPIKKDQVLAKLKIFYNQEIIGEYELLALKEVKKVNIFSRLIKSLNYLIQQKLKVVLRCDSLPYDEHQNHQNHKRLP